MNKLSNASFAYSISFSERAQVLLYDVATCATLVGKSDIAELEAQCRVVQKGRLDEANGLHIMAYHQIVQSAVHLV